MFTILARNPKYVVKHPIRTWKMTKIMREWANSVPQVCEYCNLPVTRLTRAVHHIIPLWKDETKGCDTGNYSLVHGKGCHGAAHMNHYATAFIENWKEVCVMMKRIWRSEVE